MSRYQCPLCMNSTMEYDSDFNALTCDYCNKIWFDATPSVTGKPIFVPLAESEEFML